MLVTILKARLENATVTRPMHAGHGAICIDQDLLDASGILVGEKVEIYNVRTGQVLSAPVFGAPRGSRSFTFDVAETQTGDRITISAWAMMREQEADNFDPVIIAFDDNNRVSRS
jgi:aspartate 1-decarboxylase